MPTLRIVITLYAPAALVNFAAFANLFALGQRAMAQGADKFVLGNLVATYVGVHVFASLAVGRLATPAYRNRLLLLASAALALLFGVGTITKTPLEFQATLAATTSTTTPTSASRPFRPSSTA